MKKSMGNMKDYKTKDNETEREEKTRVAFDLKNERVKEGRHNSDGVEEMLPIRWKGGGLIITDLY